MDKNEIMKKDLNKKNKNIGGYTLIETMIALAIFLIVIVIGIGALLNAYTINKKSQDMRSIMDGLSFTMEDMSRNIRTGYDYECLKDIKFTGTAVSCDSGIGIAFEYSGGNVGDSHDQWVYFIQGGKLFRSTDGLNNSVQMTPDEVSLNESTNNFSIIGAEASDKIQPLVIIRLVGTITSKGVETPFSLETAISQRKSDS